MVQTNLPTVKDINIESQQKFKSPTPSENLITIVFGLLVTLFTVLLLVIIQHLGAWVLGRTIEWRWVSTHILPIISFSLLSTTFCAVILYLLRLTIVGKKLAQAFWASIEDED